jgi:predicted kinase
LKKIILTKGLPGSGKSTWAKDYILKRTTDYGEKWKRINKDDLREMIDCGQWSKDNEKNIINVRNTLIREFIQRKYNIIIDDTNFGPHEAEIKKIVDEWNTLLLMPGDKEEYVVEIKDFTDVPLKTCIERDLKRYRSVGKDVIMRMHKQYLAPIDEPLKMAINPLLPFAIMVDIDGTLAKHVQRSPYDYSLVHTDEIYPHIREIVQKYAHEYAVVIMSGRPDSCRAETEKWLEENDVPYTHFHMRKAGDQREDSIVKKELFDAHVRDSYNVLFVLDDRNRVVDMWRSIGLNCLQVQPGDF